MQDRIFKGPRFTSKGPINEEDLSLLAYAILKKRWTSPRFIVFYVGP